MQHCLSNGLCSFDSTAEELLLCLRDKCPRALPSDEGDGVCLFVSSAGR
jgi:hypothetical protein